MKNDEAINVRGAREHNLKNISLSIPRDTLTVITGLSGSGKSSLAFDTIFAEGQRRYIESLSTYARQFLETLEKPDVESIDGLSPTIAIQQKTTSSNPRSTVGTVTEIYDFLRLLFARIATAHCYNCNKPIQSQTAQQIVEQILLLPENSKISILSPLVRERKGEYQKELQSLRQKGFSRVRIDNEILDLSQEITLDKQRKHTIDVYIDRLVLRKPIKEQPDPLRWRLQESIETATKLSEGLVTVEYDDPKIKKDHSLLFSQKHACIDCGISYPDPEPRTFSFNSPMGACAKCDGLGYFSEEKEDSMAPRAPFGVITVASHPICPECNGTRLQKKSLFYKIRDKNIVELSTISIQELSDFFKTLTLPHYQLLIAEKIIKEINERLKFLLHVGVSYLSLNRSALSLSGGENQRIRLATQIGSALTGVIYVLDEPSIGLHQRDNEKLLESLERLRDKGNTVLVVEHDLDTIKRADFIVDLGPGAGTHGGSVVATGTFTDIKKNPLSLTGQYLKQELKIDIPSARRPHSNKFILLENAHANNLKNIDVIFPLCVFTCITGVSGSGKSTLVVDTLYPALAKKIYKSKTEELFIDKIEGFENIDKVIDIDQSPIGRTPRSNPATYVGVFDNIRSIFSQLPEARMRGFKPGRFSFNVKGGRCENCQGGGLAKVEMHFLSDIYVTCDICGGKRYNDDTLAIKYKGKSIADVLALTIDEAKDFFSSIPLLSQKFNVLSEVGLGYLALGQSATTLSGGEAQRLKLAHELSRRDTGKTVYILDEPSTGLHFDDIKKLISVLQRLVDQGNTVIVIEHNLDIVKVADHIIDMGPDAGQLGGQIIAHGTPENICKNPNSITGQYLKPYLTK